MSDGWDSKSQSEKIEALRNDIDLIMKSLAELRSKHDALSRSFVTEIERQAAQSTSQAEVLSELLAAHQRFLAHFTKLLAIKVD